MINRVKVMFFVFTLCICASLCAGTEAQAKIKRGKWKDNVSWTYDTKTKEFVVTGKGEIAELYETEYDICAPKWVWISSDIRSMKIEGRITKISNFFSGISGFSNMTSLELGKNIREIGEGAFWGAPKLKSVKLNVGLRKIKKDAFQHSGLRKVVIPESVEKIGLHAFYNCEKLRKVTLREGVKDTGVASFCYCPKLEKVKFPISLKRIGARAFEASALKTVTIPENVVEIGNGAFDQKWADKVTLKKVTIKSKKITKWGKDIFNGASRDLVIHVPASKKLQYELALRAKGLPSYVRVVGEASLG
nr:leucine-rich repeat protein [Eubacterium sp.]